MVLKRQRIKSKVLTGGPGRPCSPVNPRWPFCPLSPASPASPLSPRGPCGPLNKNVTYIKCVPSHIITMDESRLCLHHKLYMLEHVIIY